MKNSKKKRDFVIHEIKRENSEEVKEVEEPVRDPNVSISIVSGIQQIPDYGEMVDCNLDPSRYDNLRKRSYKKEQPKKEEPVQVEVEKPQQQNIEQEPSNEEYYSQLADEYVEPNGEAQISEVISEEEMDSYEPVDEVVLEKEPENEVVVEQKPQTPVQKPVEPQMKKPEEPVVTTVKKKTKYSAPPLSLLTFGDDVSTKDTEFAEQQKQTIDEILKSYNIKAHVEKYIFGPTVVTYLVKMESLSEDVNVIRKIDKNLQMYLSVSNIRMLTPVPNMPYGGIEVPRPKENRSTVFLGNLLDQNEFKKSKYELPVAVGRDNFNHSIYIDLADMPHGLVAGASKSGKSVCLNSFIVSLLYHYTPEDVRLVILDPKMVEFSKYQGIPHLALPVITDAEYFEPCMEWLVNEMERRYRLLTKYGVVQLKQLNEVLEAKHLEKLPYLVMIMDEFNDWFMGASAETENNISRLMAKARAAGIDIILATQRPSADVIKGAIKANLTTRLAFRVSSQADSVVILGAAMAEKLEGYGDVILRHTGINDLRLQACFCPNDDIHAVCNYLRDNNETNYLITLEELLQSSTIRNMAEASNDPDLGRNDSKFEEICLYVVRNNNASANQLQKIFGASFNRVDKILRDMECLGMVSPAQKGAQRKVLINEMELEQILKEL